MQTTTMFYVVTRKLGEAMQGSKSCKGARSNTPSGTIYAVKGSYEAAEDYAVTRWGDAAGLMLGNTILIIPQ